MDRLYREGAWFKNAFVTTALCSPSRASILTGEYSHVHTIVDNVAPEPANLIYFPEYLQKAGYQTAFLGKWHMGNDDDYPTSWLSPLGKLQRTGGILQSYLNINGKQVIYKDSTYITDLLTEHSIIGSKSRDKSKPFFLYLSHKAVHAPVTPAKRHVGMYRNQKYPLPSTYLSNHFR